MDIYKALKYGVFAGLILCSGCRGSNDTHRTEFPVNVEVQMVSPADEMQDQWAKS